MTLKFNCCYLADIKSGLYMAQPANLIGKRVREARLTRKPRITQVQLAAQLQLEGLNIDQGQVSKIENLTRPVSDFEIAALAKVLHVSASWLLGETDRSERLLNEKE